MIILSETYFFAEITCSWLWNWKSDNVYFQIKSFDIAARKMFRSNQRYNREHRLNMLCVLKFRSWHDPRTDKLPWWATEGETFGDEYLLFPVSLPRLITAPTMVNLHASTRKELSVLVLSRCAKTSVGGQWEVNSVRSCYVIEWRHTWLYLSNHLLPLDLSESWNECAI